MFLRNLFNIYILTCLVPTAYASTHSDSVPEARQLRGIEVLGVKRMPQSGALPVTKLDRSDITMLGIDAVKDLGDIVPNLYAPSYGSRMTSSIYMRGLGSRIDQAVVGLNIDGVPYLNKDTYDFDLPDINSIEVLRGAQSVLNGRNAMAGQINAYTISPRDFQGYRFMLEYGRTNDVKASAGGYFKINDKLFTSVSTYYGHTDGFWRNDYNRKKTGRENNGSVRWKTVFSPSKAHTITNTASFSVGRQSGYPYTSTATGKIAYNDTCYYRRNYFSDGLTVAWKGKRVVVTSITSVQYLDDEMTLDQDFMPSDYFTLTQRRHEFTFTEDLFTRGSRGRYSWMGGVFGFYRRTRMWAPVTFYNAGISKLIEEKRNEMNPDYPISWDERKFPLLSEFTTPTGGFALYHQSTYKTNGWTFDLGLRWDIERTSCNYRSDADASYTTWQVLPDGSRAQFSNTPLNIHDTGKLSQTFNELMPKVVVTRELPFGAVYASFTKGYKSGGFNTQMFSDVLQQRVMETMGIPMIYNVDEIVKYRPEVSWNYEIGIRADALDKKLTAEATGFFIDCRDQQLTVFPPGTVTGRIMTNAGRTRSLGLELTAKYSPLADLQLSASYGYTNATFRKYNNGRQDFRGNRVPYSPAHTLFASLRWNTPWHPGGLSTELCATVRGVGDIMWNEENTMSQPFYALAGTSFTLCGERWSLKLWGENLSDTHYNTFYFLSMGNSFTQRGLPLTFGATIRFNINS